MAAGGEEESAHAIEEEGERGRTKVWISEGLLSTKVAPCSFSM